MKIPLEKAKERMTKDKDRMEQSGDRFYEKVIEGFNTLTESEDRIISVDATQPAGRVHDQIWEYVQDRFARN